ncbi:Gfo/Idh/MocA family protein [Egicoccus halophilus]|uniref:Dehydrogenase n=1 Tax=Egicoccus halophilus TaxID=1670830 RepID=A0A8J3ADJ3_9ACTN|nr:Gfo/Idh/MocA family oxidoreductase [Egicoccus halophilus]GGI06063.1 hypothetical protein GCM10011354_17230 [Egicoccus halophilus]
MTGAETAARPPVGVGLVGCGRIARMFHLPALRDHPGVELVGIADPDPTSRSAAVAAAPGVPVVADVGTLLRAPGLEAVVVCVPTHRHEAVAVAAFEAGVHVYVEKPLAPDLPAADRIAAAWRASGRHGVVGFNFRFHPLYGQARDALAEGSLGRLVGARTVFASSPRQLPDWKRSRATGGGALLDLATHHLDLLVHLFDAEVATVAAVTSSRRTEDDTVQLTLTFADGVSAQVLATLAAAQTDRVELFGERATLELDRMARRRPRLLPAAGPTTPRERLQAAARVVVEGASATLDGLRPPGEPSFAQAVDAFVRTVAGGTPPVAPATIGDGQHVALLVDAAERAAAQRTVVELAPADRSR